ncbi:ankyrin repeat domain-containing protein [Paenibacillus allorhizosphaerae]|uniref:Ankyrin repeat domain-containing protein n=1 Tax=Paenibacillus allorhizosphaerae TaxID=2849866 RepID=A0ABM8VJX6_9BACL|nr:ankyrin repeat domain-containing protein [Paenibacillus allorhizosphaerae]CAG7645506.1 hypothetical protein PAECIP111802_03533 [Paenibacillus allorhizosphaerae]
MLEHSSGDLTVMVWEAMRMAPWTDAEMVRLLRRLPIDLNQPLPNRATWLTLAASQGKYEAAKYMLRQRADPELPNGRGETPLLSAIQSNSIEMIDMLIRSGADPKARDRQGRTPLMLAAARGALALVRYFADIGNGLEDQDKFRGTPLAHAAKTASVDTVKYLLDRGCRPCGLLKAYIIRRRYDAIQLLLARGADPNEPDDKSSGTPLMYACCEGDARIVTLLLLYGADSHFITKEGQTALMCAAEFGHEAVIDILLSNGIALSARDSEGKTAVDYAEMQGHAPIKRKLQALGARKGDERIVYFTRR